MANGDEGNGGGGGGNPDGNQLPQQNAQAKFACPTFHGHADTAAVMAEPFIKSFLIYCRGQGYGENQQVDALSFCLKGDAYSWLREWECRFDTEPTWDNFLVVFRERYAQKPTARQAANAVQNTKQRPGETVDTFFTRCGLTAQAVCEPVPDDLFNLPDKETMIKKVKEHNRKSFQQMLFVASCREAIRTKLTENTHWDNPKECLKVARQLERALEDTQNKRIVVAPVSTRDEDGEDFDNAEVNAVRGQGKGKGKGKGKGRKQGSQAQQPAHSSHSLYPSQPPQYADHNRVIAALQAANIIPSDAGGPGEIAAAGQRGPARSKRPAHPEQVPTHDAPVQCYYCTGTHHTIHFCLRKQTDEGDAGQVSSVRFSRYPGF